MKSIWKGILNFLDVLTREIPPPKSKRPAISQNLITPEQALSPTDREIIASAEQSFRELEAQSQTVLQEIRETPVIAPAPAPVQFLEVPEILEVSEVPPIVEVSEILEVSTTSDQATTKQAPAAAPAEMPRKQLVEGLLDEAWQQGLRTYAALIGYVEQHTGKGCSKRVVSNWKKARQLEAA